MSDTDAHCIYKAKRSDTPTQDAWDLTVIAGVKNKRGYMDDETGTDALFAFPIDIALGSNNQLIVADCGNDAIRTIDLIGGGVKTIFKGERRYDTRTLSNQKFSPVQRMRAFMQIGNIRNARGDDNRNQAQAAFKVVGVIRVLHTIMTYLSPVFKWRAQLKPGDLCDAEDSGPINYPTRWFEAVVVPSDLANPNLLKIHFKGWKPRFDEIISRWSSRIQHPHTRVK